MRRPPVLLPPAGDRIFKGPAPLDDPRRPRLDAICKSRMGDLPFRPVTNGPSDPISETDTPRPKCCGATFPPVRRHSHDAGKMTMETPMLDTLVRKYHSWQMYRRTYDELSRLSNRELNDLGIGRGDIDFIARKSMR